MAEHQLDLNDQLVWFLRFLLPLIDAPCSLVLLYFRIRAGFNLARHQAMECRAANFRELTFSTRNFGPRPGIPAVYAIPSNDQAVGTIGNAG